MQHAFIVNLDECQKKDMIIANEQYEKDGNGWVDKHKYYLRYSTSFTK